MCERERDLFNGESKMWWNDVKWNDSALYIKWDTERLHSEKNSQTSFSGNIVLKDFCVKTFFLVFFKAGVKGKTAIRLK